MANWKTVEMQAAAKKASEAIKELTLALNKLKNPKKFIHQSKYHR